jgi:hypothetical protein
MLKSTSFGRLVWPGAGARGQRAKGQMIGRIASISGPYSPELGLRGLFLRSCQGTVVRRKTRGACLNCKA